MPLFAQHRTDDVRWGIWRVEEEEEVLLSLLSSTNCLKEALAKFKAPHRRIEWLAVRVLLATMMEQERVVSYHSNGRPYLAEGDYSLSISHTKGYVAVALAPADKLVGIDIEQRGERVRKVANRFMGEQEQASLYEGSDLTSLLLHWSAKESIYKCLDRPDVEFSDHLHILPFEVEQQGTFDAFESRTTHQQHYRIHYLLHPDYVLTLACPC